MDHRTREANRMQLAGVGYIVFWLGVVFVLGVLVRAL